MAAIGEKIPKISCGLRLLDVALKRTGRRGRPGAARPKHSPLCSIDKKRNFIVHIVYGPTAGARSHSCALALSSTGVNPSRVACALTYPSSREHVLLGPWSAVATDATLSISASPHSPASRLVSARAPQLCRRALPLLNTRWTLPSSALPPTHHKGSVVAPPRSLDMPSLAHGT